MITIHRRLIIHPVAASALNAVDLGSEALASQVSGEDESSLPKNNAQVVCQQYWRPSSARLIIVCFRAKEHGFNRAGADAPTSPQIH